MRAYLVLLEEGANPLKNSTNTLKIARIWAGRAEFTEMPKA